MFHSGVSIRWITPLDRSISVKVMFAVIPLSVTVSDPSVELLICKGKPDDDMWVPLLKSGENTVWFKIT